MPSAWILLYTSFTRTPGLWTACIPNTGSLNLFSLISFGGCLSNNDGEEVRSLSRGRKNPLSPASSVEPGQVVFHVHDTF